MVLSSHVRLGLHDLWGSTNRNFNIGWSILEIYLENPSLLGIETSSLYYMHWHAARRKKNLLEIWFLAYLFLPKVLDPWNTGMLLRVIYDWGFLSHCRIKDYRCSIHLKVLTLLTYSGQSVRTEAFRFRENHQGVIRVLMRVVTSEL